MDDEAVRHENYVAYMLRLWQVGSRSGKSVWRASLENPHTGERQAFGDVEALVAFLAEITRASLDTGKALETSARADTQQERTVP